MACACILLWCSHSKVPPRQRSGIFTSCQNQYFSNQTVLCSIDDTMYIQIECIIDLFKFGRPVDPIIVHPAPFHNRLSVETLEYHRIHNFMCIVCREKGRGTTFATRFAVVLTELYVFLLWLQAGSQGGSVSPIAHQKFPLSCMNMRQIRWAVIFFSSLPAKSLPASVYLSIHMCLRAARVGPQFIMSIWPMSKLSAVSEYFDHIMSYINT